MEKITHEVRCQQWKKIISECLASGLSKTEWCRQNGISDKSFFYWQKILRREMYETSTSTALIPKETHAPAIPFVELKLDSPAHDTQLTSGFHPDAVIQANGIIIGLSNSASPDLVHALGGLLHAE